MSLTVRTGLRPASAPGGGRRYASRAELRQDLHDLLLAVHDLAEKALAVDVAVLVPGRIHQHVRLLLRRNGEAVGRLGKELAVELAHLLGHVLDEVDGRIALDPIVVAEIVEARLEFLGELLYRRDRRVDGEADVAPYAVRGIPRELDHFLAEQGGLTDQGLVEALLLRLD